MVDIQVCVEPALHEQLVNWAEDLGVSLSTLTIAILEKATGAHERGKAEVG